MYTDVIFTQVSLITSCTMWCSMGEIILKSKKLFKQHWINYSVSFISFKRYRFFSEILEGVTLSERLNTPSLARMKKYIFTDY